MMPQLVLSLLVQVMVIGSHLGRKHLALTLFDSTGFFLAHLRNKRAGSICQSVDGKKLYQVYNFDGFRQYNFRYLQIFQLHKI